MEKCYDSLKSMLESNLKKIERKGDVSTEDLKYVKEATEALHYMRELCDKPQQGMSYGYHYGPDRSPVTGRYIGMDHGYSGHSIKDRMIAKIEQLYDDAGSEHERQMISNEINRLRTEV